MICASEGRATRSKRAASAMSCPGVQNPHWKASAAMNASCSRWSLPPSPRPSMVVTARATQSTASTRQAVHRLAVEEHRACPAIAHVAGLLGAGEAEVGAQGIEERAPRLDVKLDVLPVHAKRRHGAFDSKRRARHVNCKPLLGSMRIAQIAPLAEAVPPKLYGGTERVVSYLSEELVR